MRWICLLHHNSGIGNLGDMTLSPESNYARLHKPGSSPSGQVASKGSRAFRSSISHGFCVQINPGIQNPTICVIRSRSLLAGCVQTPGAICNLGGRSHIFKSRPAGQSQPWHKAPPTHFQTGSPHETTGDTTPACSCSRASSPLNQLTS